MSSSSSPPSSPEAPHTNNLLQIDASTCAQLQQEERDALTAIYEELVTFETGERMIDSQGRIIEKHVGCTVEGDEINLPSPGFDPAAVLHALSLNANPVQGSVSISSSSTASTSTSFVRTHEKAQPHSLSLPTSTIATQQCTSVTLTIKPSHTVSDSVDRNSVSTRVRFILPPLYPYIRPAFTVLACDGMRAVDGAGCASAIQTALDEIYSAKEPMDESDVRVILFDLINTAQEFLIEYIASSEDRIKRAALATEQAERDAKQVADQARLAAEQAHIASALAYQTSSHTSLEWSNVNHAPSAEDLEKFKSARRAEQAIEREIATVERSLHNIEAIAKHSHPVAVGDEQYYRNLPSYLGIPSSSSVPPTLDSFSHLLPSTQQVMQYIAREDNAFPSNYRADFEKRDGIWMKYIGSSQLIYQFLKKRVEFQAKGIPIEIELGFYGQNMGLEEVERIVKHGFRIPDPDDEDDGSSSSETCHQVQGIDRRGRIRMFPSDGRRGVILSPLCSHAMRYTGNSSSFPPDGGINGVLVCFVMRGRVYELVRNVMSEKERKDEKRRMEAESYTYWKNTSLQEWIVFDAHAVLPIYMFSMSDPEKKSAAAAYGSKHKDKAAASSSSASSSSAGAALPECVRCECQVLR